MNNLASLYFFFLSFSVSYNANKIPLSFHNLARGLEDSEAGNSTLNYFLITDSVFPVNAQTLPIAGALYNDSK